MCLWWQWNNMLCGTNERKESLVCCCWEYELVNLHGGKLAIFIKITNLHICWTNSTTFGNLSYRHLYMLIHYGIVCDYKRLENTKICSKRHWLNKAHPYKKTFGQLSKNMEIFQLMIWKDCHDFMLNKKIVY